MDGGCANIFGMFTSWTLLWFPRRGTTQGVRGEACKSTPSTFAISKECQVGVEHHKQCKTAISSALALCQQFTVHGDVLERVEVFKYLGRMMAQDDNDIQAIRAQLRKARATWARVGQVLRSENASPPIAARFYQAIVQAILLYGSETWVISRTALTQLKGFHIRAAYRWPRRISPSAALAMCGSIQDWWMF